MTAQTKAVNKANFETGDVPTQAQFVDLIDSYEDVGTAASTVSTHAALTATHGATGAVVGTTNTQTLTNKTLTDPVIGGTITGTYTIGGTPTFPSSVATLTGTQTLTNKTLTSPTMTAPVLGTPASGTLTNCTGLPTAGLVDDAVTNAKLANMANATIKGRTTAGTGDPEDLTATQTTALLNVFTTALKGLAPASGGGTTNFLRADGTWAAPAGGGGGISWSTAVDANVVPDADGTRSLGSGTNRFATLHVDNIDLNGVTLDGTTLADPNADRILFWDDSAGATAYLDLGAGLAITATTLNVTSAVATLTGTQTLTNKTLTSPTMTAPALGTPASGTLTNCTGLPVTGIAASTSAAIGVGTIELGHASDTTISRSAAGVIAVEGVPVFPNLPQNSQSAAYTLVLADANRHILHPSADTTARTFTIPANASVAFPIGTAVTFVNQNAAGVVTIAITTDTMRLAGAGTTGSRTLAANGMATALKITATEWIISGTGLT
jgi:hypothetical protein